MWFYRKGVAFPTTHHAISTGGQGSEVVTLDNAIDVMNDANIPVDQRWDTTDTMSNTVFAICRVKYDQAHGITGLGQMKFLVKNTLGNTTNGANGTGPGSVIKDYLQNVRYGCGVNITNIDTASLSALDTFSYANGAFTIQDLDNVTVTNRYRYRISGIVDTNQNCLTNLNMLAETCDSWIQWNEATAKWGVVINRSLEQAGGSTSTMSLITAANIIGGIGVNPTDLNSMGNSIQIAFPNSVFRDANNNTIMIK